MLVSLPVVREIALDGRTPRLTGRTSQEALSGLLRPLGAAGIALAPIQLAAIWVVRAGRVFVFENA